MATKSFERYLKFLKRNSSKSPLIEILDSNKDVILSNSELNTFLILITESAKNYILNRDVKAYSKARIMEVMDERIFIDLINEDDLNLLFFDSLYRITLEAINLNDDLVISNDIESNYPATLSL